MEQINFTLYLILFLLALGFIIFVHELGHFATAKWVGIKVRRFAVGLGKPFISWRKGMGLRMGATEAEYEKLLKQGRTDLGETEYALCYVPLGGYVAMLGQEDMDPTKVSDDPRAYNNKPIWQRMVVVSAGVVMNLIFAVVFFIAAFMIGTKFPPAQVGDVAYGTPAMSATTDASDVAPGLLPGDRFLRVQGDQPSDFTELRVASALAKAGQPLEAVVQRPAWRDEPARTLRFTMTPKPGEMKLLSIGVMPPSTNTLIDARTLERETTGTLAAKFQKHGLEPGMTLVAVDGHEVTERWQYLRALHESGGAPLELTFHKAGGDATKTITIEPVGEMPIQRMATLPQVTQEQEPVPHMLGLVPAVVLPDVMAGGAAEGKLKAGDIVAKVGEYDWPTFEQFMHVVKTASGPIAFTVLRGGAWVDVEVTPQRKVGGVVGKKMIGVSVGWGDNRPVVSRVLADSPLAELNIPPGSTIDAINGRPIESFQAIRRAVLAADADDLEVTYTRPLLGGTTETATITLTDETRQVLVHLPWRDPIGAVLFTQLEALQQTSNPIAAAGMGFDKTWLFLNQTYLTLLRLVEGSISPKHMSGPVGIGHIGTKMAERGFTYLLYFMGLISVNLAVINFLPLPIVDGGLFVMLCIEKLRGKPLPLGLQSAITMAGVVLLAAVFLFVTYNDIARLING